MANVLSRTSPYVYLVSVNDPDYPVVDWIHSPDLSAVNGWDSRYWIVTGDVVSLMSETERNAVDAALLDASREDSVQQQIDNIESVLRAFMKTVLTEFNLHAAKHNEIATTVDAATNLAEFKTAMQAVNDYPARTVAQLRISIRNNLGS